jgi:CheY-like chemotaxis protein
LKIFPILGLLGCSFVSDFVLRISDFDWEFCLEKLMSGKNILLVEDNEVNRRLAGFLLRSQGYQVREATTALEAFEMLKNDRPDLIVMDIQLPGMDGLEVTRKLKEQPATADIPVIAVTSYAMKGDREKALAAGCAGYVTKPIDKNTFIQEVAAHVGNKSKIEDGG